MSETDDAQRIDSDDERRDRGAQQPTTQMGVDSIKDLVASLDEEAKKALAAELVSEVFPAEAKKVAEAEAVKTAPHVIKQDVAAEAMISLPSDEARRAVTQQFLRMRTQAVADEIWLTVVKAFKWVLWTSTLGLFVMSVLAVFRNVALANTLIMLTAFTTTAGILAGFLGGKAVGSFDVAGSVAGLQVFKAFKWVLVIATSALVAAVGVAFFREVDQILIQILLMVLTTVVGNLAGLISGEATERTGRN